MKENLNYTIQKKNIKKHFLKKGWTNEGVGGYAYTHIIYKNIKQDDIYKPTDIWITNDPFSNETQGGTKIFLSFSYGNDAQACLQHNSDILKKIKQGIDVTDKSISEIESIIDEYINIDIKNINNFY